MDPDGFELRFPGLANAMEPAELTALLAQLHQLDLAAGEILITEGTPTHALYLVWEGTLSVSVGLGADERDVNEVERGGYLGEVSLLDAGPATATVRSEVGATVLALEHEGLDAFRRTHPTAGAALLRELGMALASRVRTTGRRVAAGHPDRHAVLEGAAVDPSDLRASFGALMHGLPGGADLADTLAGLAEVHELPSGATVAEGGSRTSHIHLLLSGQVVRRGDDPAVDSDVIVLDAGSLLSAERLMGVVSGGRLDAVDGVTVASVSLDAMGPLRGSQDAIDAPLLEAAARQLARELRALTAGLPSTATTANDAVDVAVIGGGPIGLSYAWFLKEARPGADITVLDRRDEPDYKVGESTLGTTTRAFLRMGLPMPVLRRLFGIKAGIRFWWTDIGDTQLHDHVDVTDLEETFQVERRVLETALIASARRKGIDVRMGTRVDARNADISADGVRLPCETDVGDAYDLRARMVCDASGRASVLTRRFGLHRRDTERLGSFNTNSYYAYFRLRTDAPIPLWDQPATRHICFPQGWCWFITVVSWEGTPQANLEAMVDFLLDHPDGPDESYPTRRELEQRFGAQSEVLLSIGFTVREDQDTALGQSVAGRFQHYVERYPAFGDVLSHYDLVEDAYGKRQPYSAFQRLAHDAEAVAGDGWCAVGDAAMFSNPLFSPGMNLGTGTAFEAAADSARALQAGDVSRSAFRAYQHYAERTYASLMGLNDFLYRSFVHRRTYERALMMFFFHGFADVAARETYSETDPYIWDLLNPEFTRRIDQIRGLLRGAETAGGDPGPIVRAAMDVADGYIAKIAPQLEEAGLDISRATRQFSRQGVRQETYNTEPSIFTPERCTTCRQWYDGDLARCVVCGTANPLRTAATV